MVVEQIFPSLTWRIRHEVMYPDRSLDFVKLEDDFEGIHFGLYLDHELSGVVSLFIKGEEAQFRKLAVLQKSQHQGLGKFLMQYLIDFCNVQGIKKLWCNARVNALQFYFKLGFTATEETFTAAGFDFVKLELSLAQPTQ